MSIPKIIHYCFGMEPQQGGKEWSLVHHICVKSAIEKINPDKIFIYYCYEPQTYWWSLTKKLVQPVQIDDIHHIHGRSLQSAAHKADVIRLQKLIAYGGIYLDADVIVHQSLDQLLNNDLVMAEEGPAGQYGIANAVILAAPYSLFLTRWLQQYKWFRGGKIYSDPFWSEHSVQLPKFMAHLFPNEIKVLDYKAFHWPLWIDSHLIAMFEESKKIDLSRTYCTHLWESLSWKWLKTMTPGSIRSSNSNFANWAKPYVEHLSDEP